MIGYCIHTSLFCVVTWLVRIYLEITCLTTSYVVESFFQEGCFPVALILHSIGIGTMKGQENVLHTQAGTGKLVLYLEVPMHIVLACDSYIECFLSGICKGKPSGHSNCTGTAITQSRKECGVDSSCCSKLNELKSP